ncbi:hypothetical protein BP5796_09539 [Coleophoma crateriformis]|uniref:C2H2-type domain-containing protein n=1 Tax=Coleophoma crateriformis TaxID=565419 RepID=A0A3D8QYP2_9HELO|nr:hypothetical protein BP5796_09539 [Coleophoma crateriformis]
MPPRGFTLPAAKTESAREAVKSFYCELCSKGYARMNEYEAHLSSYDHSHKQRLKDMRQLSRDPMASSKARKAEAKANSQSGLISIKLGGESGGTSGGKDTGAAGGGGFKKGGFKKVGFKSAFAPVDAEGSPATAAASGGSPLSRSVSGDGGEKEGSRLGRAPREDKDLGESDTEDEGYEMYDPRHPTD